MRVTFIYNCDLVQFYICESKINIFQKWLTDDDDDEFKKLDPRRAELAGKKNQIKNP